MSFSVKVIGVHEAQCCDLDEKLECFKLQLEQYMDCRQRMIILMRGNLDYSLDEVISALKAVKFDVVGQLVSLFEGYAYCLKMADEPQLARTCRVIANSLMLAEAQYVYENTDFGFGDDNDRPDSWDGDDGDGGSPIVPLEDGSRVLDRKILRRTLVGL